jgi:hypothetical protein
MKRVGLLDFLKSTNPKSEIRLLSLCCFSHSSSMWSGGAGEICGDVDPRVCSLYPSRIRSSSVILMDRKYELDDSLFRLWPTKKSFIESTQGIDPRSSGVSNYE